MSELFCRKISDKKGNCVERSITIFVLILAEEWQGKTCDHNMTEILIDMKTENFMNE